MGMKLFRLSSMSSRCVFACFFLFRSGILVAEDGQDLPAKVQGGFSDEPQKEPIPEVRDSLPEKPQDYVVDDCNLFSLDQRAAFSNKSWELAKRQNVHLYLVTSYYMHGENAQQRAKRLANMWLRSGGLYGAVVFFDQSTRGRDAIGLACTEDGTGVLVEADLLRLLTNANAAARGSVGSSSQRMEAAYQSLAMGFQELKPRMEQGRRLPPKQWFLVGLVVGCMMLTLLLLWWAKRIERKNDLKRRAIYLFPEVTVQPRFGAYCGGGVMAQAHFKTTV
jgi:hypothetical protein